jgi:hypothetical protein
MLWRWSVGFVGLVAAVGCGQSRGPLNPSFEEACVGCSTPATPASWSPFPSSPGIGIGPIPRHLTGTGFVPTDGIYFLDIVGVGGGLNPYTAGMRQDNVDLSSTSTLMFDYEAIGTVPAAEDVGGEDATATVEILFTSMGTITLWSKSFPVGEVNEQMRDVEAMVDAPSDPGRMLIQVTVEARDANNPELELRIDNLRVQ